MTKLMGQTEHRIAKILCLGQAVQDFVFSVDALPDAGEKYRAHAFETVGGGPAATAAVTIAKLNGHAQLIARLGDDQIGDLILNELTGYGVDCELVRRFAGQRSSLSAVMLDKAGERMIVNYLDPELPQNTDWLPEIKADAVLADTRWVGGSKAILSSAKAAGLPAILDADRPVPKGAELISCASHVAFSAEGLSDWAGDDDHRQNLKEAARQSGAWCCVTLGGDGVLFTTSDGIQHMPAFKVDVVDSLGAGDVWHGAFALCLGEGGDEEDALRFANATAALKVGRKGGRRGTPTRLEVEDYLAAHPPQGE